MPGETVLRLERVALGYGGEPILREVDLDLYRGEVLAVIGRNGSGKSTLLAGILGTLAPAPGKRVGTPTFGYSPQRGQHDAVFPFLSEEVVAMGLVGRGRLTAEERRQRVAAALDATGLTDEARTAFRDLSGGQRQRALIARALAAEPEVLVLDEPTNNLDIQGQSEVLAVLRRLNSRGATLVLVSHDLRLVRAVGDRVAMLQDQRVTLVDPDVVENPEAISALLGLEDAFK
ncbi:MAG: ATP-binding cassette domain-containing protein [Planctomycetota bacterium]